MPTTNQTSERWTPYFKSKRLRSFSHGEAIQSAAADGDEEAEDSNGLETAAMQVRVQLFNNDFYMFWKMIVRRAQPFGLCKLTCGGSSRNVNLFAAPSSRSSDPMANR